MLPELIIGIDPSLRSTGICHQYNDGTFTTQTIVTTEKNQYPKVTIWEEISDVIYHAKKYNRNISAAIEQYPFNMKGSKAAYGIEVGSIIRLALEINGIPYIVVSQNSWKAAILKKGWFGLKKGTKAKDAAYLQHVKDSIGISFETTDEADAYCIAQFAKKERESNGD